MRDSKWQKKSKDKKDLLKEKCFCTNYYLQKRFIHEANFFRIIFFPDYPVIYAGFADAAEPKLVEKTISLGEMHTDWDMYIPSLKISPDSTRMAYMARKKNKFAVIENGRISPEFDGIGKDTPLFSPDSKHLAYIAKKGDQWHVVHDGRISEGYDAVFTPVFSPDSQRLAYAAKKGDKQFVVVDGNKANSL